jgi:phosphoglycerate dehydrogenase-like enzyme
MATMRFLILNGSCLDRLEVHRPWLEQQAVEIVGHPSFKKLTMDQLDGLLPGVHAVIGPAAAAVQLLPRHMEMTPTLQVISLASSGYEWVDRDAATRYGIVVSFAATRSLSEMVADHTWGMMLAAARQIPYHHMQLQAGNRQRGLGSALWGKTLGVIGLGRIGRCVARRAIGFEMKVIACEINPNRAYMREQDIELVSLDELLRRSDFVSIHVRLEPSTYHMIGARELALMKPTAYFVNTARQQLVDEAALAQAILDGRIAGAAIDDPPELPDSPLLHLPNVVCTPHIGNRVTESVDAVCEYAYQAALEVLRGDRQPELLRNPEVYQGPLRAPYPRKLRGSHEDH